MDKQTAIYIVAGIIYASAVSGAAASDEFDDKKAEAARDGAVDQAVQLWDMVKGVLKDGEKG